MSHDVIHMRLSELMRITEHHTTLTAGRYVIDAAIVRLFGKVVTGDAGTIDFSALRVWHEYLESARVDNE